MSKGNAVAKLNEGHRECLRLVLLSKNSKEIARELGISPHTVDQRLRQAIHILKAENRFDAAQIYDKSLGDDKPDLPPEQDLVALPLPSHPGQKNKLTAKQRLMWVFLLMVGSALAFGGILAGLTALSQINR